MCIKDEATDVDAKATDNTTDNKKKSGWIKDNVDDINSFVRSANNLNVLLAALVAYFLKVVWPAANPLWLRIPLGILIVIGAISVVLVYLRTVINFWDILTHERNDYNVDLWQICYVVTFMLAITIVPLLSFAIIFDSVINR